MMATEIKKAIEQVKKTGFAEIGNGNGVFLQTGKELIGLSTEDEIAEFELEENGIYITTDNGVTPEVIGKLEDSEEDLLHVAVDSLKDCLNDEIVQRYVIYEKRCNGEQAVRILDSCCDEIHAISKLDATWESLSSEAKKITVLELASVACVKHWGRITDIIDTDVWLSEIEARGWDYWEGYSPIAVRSEKTT